MAVLYMDGFDHYSTAGATNYIYTPAPTLWSAMNGNLSGSSNIVAMPVLGGLGLGVLPNGSATNDSGRAGHPVLLLPIAPATGLTMGFGFHFYTTSFTMTSGSNIPGLIAFSAGTSAPTKSIAISTGGQLSWCNGVPGTLPLGNSGANVLATSTLYHIEVKILFHASAGTVELRVNGVVYLNLSGINTLPTSATHLEFAPVGLGALSTTPSVVFNYDNLMIWDSTGSINNNFLGERNVQTIFPNADTATAVWAKSSGVNGYDLINDVPGVSTNYLESSVVGDASVFDLQTLTNNNVAIIAVQTNILAEKTDAGAGAIQFGPRSNGNDSLSASTNMTQSQYLYFYKVSELDPNGNITWTPAAITNLQTKLLRSA